MVGIDMFCDRCGTNLQGAPAFCPTCGKATGLVPPPLQPAPRPVYASRIAGHLRNLAYFWIVFSVLRLLPRLFFWHFWRSNWFWDGGFPFGRFMDGVIGISMVSAVAGVITGWGLLERQSWARVLAIVLGFLSLIQIPFGTALGIYTLWVLLPAQSEQEYRQIST